MRTARSATVLTLVGLLGMTGCGGPETAEEAAQTQETALGPLDGHDLPPADLERVQDGDPAPDFTLEAYEAEPVTLSDFRGQKNVVLVFYRGHWWPYCASQLGELRDLLSEDLQATTQILAVSTDDGERQEMMMDRVAEMDGRAVDYPLLSDPDAAVVGRYGLLNLENQRDRPVPHPTTYVIDMDGMVRWHMTEVNYRVRPENADIIRELEALR